MGRGLSDLQRFILRRAGEQPQLAYAEVLVEYFGWRPVAGTLRRGRDGVVRGGLHWFDPNAIGRQRYRSSRAVLSQACSRLAARGLVRCLQGAQGSWSAVPITDAGRASLAADSIAKPPAMQPIGGGEQS
jgi:hypothetical protein